MPRAGPKTIDPRGFLPSLLPATTQRPDECNRDLHPLSLDLGHTFLVGEQRLLRIYDVKIADQSGLVAIRGDPFRTLSIDNGVVACTILTCEKLQGMTCSMTIISINTNLSNSIFEALFASIIYY